MSAKNPDRYGKGMRSVSTTVTEEIFAEMERLASEGNLKLTAWARHALTDTARAGSVYGITDLKKHPKNTPVSSYIQNTQQTPAEAHGDSIHDPSDKSAGGSKTAKTPTRYQKAIKRKSAG